MQNGRIDIEVSGEVYLFIVHNRLKKTRTLQYTYEHNNKVLDNMHVGKPE